MKADIQHQIAMIDEQIAFPEIYEFVTEDVIILKRRKHHLETILSAPRSEIGQNVVNFVYKR